MTKKSTLTERVERLERTLDRYDSALSWAAYKQACADWWLTCFALIFIGSVFMLALYGAACVIERLL